MNYMLFCAGTDYKTTSLEKRECLSFDDGRAILAIKKICEKEHIKGCVILSTCNRSEIYILSDMDIEADKLLLECAGENEFEGKINVYRDIEVVYHLIETACGINSAVKRESQIISQISHSADLSRKLGLIGSELDVLFRTAVSVGRGAVAEGADGSRLTSAYKAVEILEKNVGLKGKKCVIIGNGKVGLLAARLLVERGAEVVVTLRSYRHGESVVPEKCRSIAYSDRINAIKDCDILISATKSPHFTLTSAMTEGIRLPEYIIDLAVPRDIEPEVYKDRNIKYYNIDDFVSDSDIDSEVYDMVESGVSEYMGWYNYRESLDTIEDIKNIISRRIAASSGLEYKTVYPTVERTVDMLLGSIKESITPEILEKCLSKIKGRARL